MTATNHTEHYGLSRYTEDDSPTYTGDYNSDMAAIDAAIYAASQSGGMATVEHTADLTGNGTVDSPLGVADTIARTGDILSLSANYVTMDTYNTLVARVAALEQALTQPAQAATGLTATQLDTQYSDNYNIVRAGTPTRSTESEESSHE